MAKSKNKSRRVLSIDVGGSHVKVQIAGRGEVRKFESGPTLTAQLMVEGVRELTGDWKFDVISIGYPGIVLHGKIVTEPHNLGRGWVGFKFRDAFKRPVKVINDAAMQAIGSYAGGRMLFLGLGTGLGSAMIVDGIVESMELAHMTFKKGKTFEDWVGDAGRRKLGQKRWRVAVQEVVDELRTALEADYVVLGGGNARRLKKLPKTARLGKNDFAFLGGVRMWRKQGLGARKSIPPQ